MSSDEFKARLRFVEATTYPLGEVGEFIADCGDAVTAWKRVSNGDAPRAVLAQVNRNVSLTRASKEIASGRSTFLIPELGKRLAKLDDLAPHDRPLGLWVRGSTDVVTTRRDALAIVGCHAPSRDAREATTEFTSDFANRRLDVATVAAGELASAAQRATVRSGRPGLVVAAGGVDALPLLDRSRLRRVLACGGAIVSPFALGTRSTRHHADAAAVVLAAITAGTLLVEESLDKPIATFEAALALGRKTFAIDFPELAGVRERIADRTATPVTSARRLMRQLTGIDAYSPDWKEVSTPQERRSH